jgi:hypothetical protein
MEAHYSTLTSKSAQTTASLALASVSVSDVFGQMEIIRWNTVWIQ